MQSPIYQQFPRDGLESVVQCPLCGSPQRQLLFTDLRDWTFNTSAGSWSLYRCRQCSLGYLDPRPNAGALPQAYADYYTHAANADPLVARTSLDRRQLARNWYINRHWHTSLPAASWLGGLFYAVTRRSWRRRLSRLMRALPVPASGKLLDVGCGNGEFLLLAQQCGWQVCGVDTDPKAVVQARSRQLDVRLGGIDVLADEQGSFAAITLSHVIEHVYQPLELLRRCRALLRPGGVLWIETPNLDSLSARLYGRYWRGLEPPRHLMLFNHATLTRLLQEAGMEQLHRAPYTPTFAWMIERSWNLQRGSNRPLPFLHKIGCGLLEQYLRLVPAKRDMVTMLARAPLQ
jgi:2-polyprenyl-3-methyl-5-hydroxy-6-metoxy-1,4-benzoquinol methylase